MNSLKMLKDRLPDLKVIAGSVATAQGVKDLAKLGADGLRVGISAGSICTTRVVAGIGVPQFTAVQDCASAAKDWAFRQSPMEVFGSVAIWSSR